MLIDGQDEIYFADRDNCIFHVKVKVAFVCYTIFCTISIGNKPEHICVLVISVVDPKLFIPDPDPT
jgi:hypothetical protein